MPRGARRQAQPSPEEFPFRHGRKDRQSRGQTSTARVGGINRSMTKNGLVLHAACWAWERRKEKGDFGFPFVPSKVEGFTEEVRF